MSQNLSLGPLFLRLSLGLGGLARIQILIGFKRYLLKWSAWALKQEIRTTESGNLGSGLGCFRSQDLALLALFAV